MVVFFAYIFSEGRWETFVPHFDPLLAVEYQKTNKYCPFGLCFEHFCCKMNPKKRRKSLNAKAILANYKKNKKTNLKQKKIKSPIDEISTPINSISSIPNDDDTKPILDDMSVDIVSKEQQKKKNRRSGVTDLIDLSPNDMNNMDAESILKQHAFGVPGKNNGKSPQTTNFLHNLFRRFKKRELPKENNAAKEYGLLFFFIFASIPSTLRSKKKISGFGGYYYNSGQNSMTETPNPDLAHSIEQQAFNYNENANFESNDMNLNLGLDLGFNAKKKNSLRDLYHNAAPIQDAVVEESEIWTEVRKFQSSIYSSSNSNPAIYSTADAMPYFAENVSENNEDSITDIIEVEDMNASSSEFAQMENEARLFEADPESFGRKQFWFQMKQKHFFIFSYIILNLTMLLIQQTTMFVNTAISVLEYKEIMTFDWFDTEFGSKIVNVFTSFTFFVIFLLILYYGLKFIFRKKNSTKLRMNFKTSQLTPFSFVIIILIYLLVFISRFVFDFLFIVPSFDESGFFEIGNLRNSVFGEIFLTFTFLFWEGS